MAKGFLFMWCCYSPVIGVKKESQFTSNLGFWKRNQVQRARNLWEIHLGRQTNGAVSPENLWWKGMSALDLINRDRLGGSGIELTLKHPLLTWAKVHKVFRTEVPKREVNQLYLWETSLNVKKKKKWLKIN